MNILVIGGGVSAEREVSLKSARAVQQAIDSELHNVTFYDWDGSAQWLEQNLPHFEVVLPILHGKGGEDGEIQLILEQSNTPFLGSGSAVSKLCFDKYATEEKLQKLGINTPSGTLVTYEEYTNHPLFKKSHALKPYNEGSSIDTFLYPGEPPHQHLKIIEEAFNKNPRMLLEPFIHGNEITVAVLEGCDLPVIEIIPPENEVFNFTNKYNGKTQELCPPKHVSIQLQTEAKKLANKIHQAFGCRHISRIDMIVHEGELFVLEINTLPGMTSKSLFPLATQSAGLSFEQMVQHLMRLAAKK